MIRSCISTPDGDITPALDFATSHLAPRAPTNPQFLEDLEKTLSLLIFPTENLAPSLAKLLDPELRKTIATRVGEAIRQNQGAACEAKLQSLVRARAWAEHSARDAKKDLPERLDIGLELDQANESEDTSASQSHDGNAEDSAMQEQGDVDPMVQ